MSICVFFFFFKQKTAYEMRISDWSSDVCSSDLVLPPVRFPAQGQGPKIRALLRSNQPTSENEDDPQEHDLPLVRRHRARSRDLLCRNLPGQRRGGGPPRAGGFSVR